MTRHLSAALPLALLFPAMAAGQSVFDLDEIVFSANATETELDRIGNSVSIVTEEDLESAGDLQLTEYLARLAGVSLSQNGPQGGTADVRIRGAQGRYISVYIDGILVTDPSGTETTYEDFGGLTTGSIRRIEILRGSQSALYGGTAVGGVINISTIAGGDVPEGTTQTAAVEVGSYNTYALSYGLTQRTGPLTLSLGLDHTRSDGFSAAEENVGNTEADGFDRSRLSFGAAYEVSSALTFGLNGFVERGSQEFDEGFGVPFDGTPDEVAERDTAGLRAYLSYDAGGMAHEAAVSAYRIERNSFSDGFAAGLSTFEGRRLAFDYTGTTDLNEAFHLAVGLSAMREEARFTNLPGGVQNVDTYGTFLEGVWSPNDSFDLTGTIRYDDHSAFGGKTTGRLSFAWRPDTDTVLRGAIGTGYRPPSLNQLYGDYDDTNYPFFGFPGLEPEESLSLELGVDRDFASGARLSTTIFRLDIDNLVGPDSCPTIGGQFDPCQPGTFSTLQNIPGISRRQGMELSGQLPLSESLILNGAYTYTEAHDADGNRLARVPRHDLALAIDAGLGGNWSNSTSLRRVTDVLDTAKSDFGEATLGDSYTTVDTTFTYGLSDGAEAYFRIQNVFNTQYQTRSGYGTSDRAVYVGLRSRF